MAIAFALPSTTPMPVRIGASGAIALGYLLPWVVPPWFKRRHVRDQNRLLDRCRALLILGSRAHSEGNKSAALDVLDRIRRLERLWHFGNTLCFRIALAMWAAGSAVTLCICVRFAGFLTMHYGNTGQFMTDENVLSDLWIAVVLSATAIIHALASYFESWVNPWAIDNCGDRLSKFIFGSRTLAVAPESGTDVPNFDGLSAREVFGLSVMFTRHDLDRARRHLVAVLHPDRWQQASFLERHLREEALKRVNAAYDSLRREVG